MDTQSKCYTMYYPSKKGGLIMIGSLSRVSPDEGKKKYSIIHWQTGEPKESGAYLITTDEGTVALASFYPDNSSDVEFFEICVSAWCKLSDIKAYSNE